MFYFQTTNKHKFKEAKKIFEKYNLELEWIPEKYREIQASSLEEVAIESIKEIGKKNVFIEDAGLFIKALKGFPGVYSSYVEKTIGNEGILKLMKGIEERDAEFISIVAFLEEVSPLRVKVFKGIVKGNISYEARGKEGFGFDPIFIPKGYNKTFAEDINIKMKLSHRKESIEKLARYLSMEVEHGKNAF